MTSEEARLRQSLREVAAMAKREANSGAPGGMIAVYVRIATDHAIADHDGPWQDCHDCHFALQVA